MFEAVPEVALEAARPKLGLLAHAIPELLAREPAATLAVFDNPDQIRGAVQAALREWLLAISKERSLMLAVDDLQAIDEPSAAFVALLARDAKRNALFIAASLESGVEHAAASAIELFRESAVKLELGSLRADLSEKLLRSVFGDVPIDPLEHVRTASMIAEMVSMPSDVTGLHGERYRLVLLSHPVPGGFAITGVAVAIVEPGRAFVYPGPTAAQLSRTLLDCGDVVAATVVD